MAPTKDKPEPSWKKWENYEPTTFQRGVYGKWHRQHKVTPSAGEEPVITAGGTMLKYLPREAKHKRFKVDGVRLK